eukprot:scaffold1552_cov175-Amphora_coffeaeformis.AAC.9
MSDSGEHQEKTLKINADDQKDGDAVETKEKSAAESPGRMVPSVPATTSVHDKESSLAALSRKDASPIKDINKNIDCAAEKKEPAASPSKPATDPKTSTSQTPATTTPSPSRQMCAVAASTTVQKKETVKPSSSPLVKIAPKPVPIQPTPQVSIPLPKSATAGNVVSTKAPDATATAPKVPALKSPPNTSTTAVGLRKPGGATSAMATTAASVASTKAPATTAATAPKVLAPKPTLPNPSTTVGQKKSEQHVTPTKANAAAAAAAQGSPLPTNNHPGYYPPGHPPPPHGQYQHPYPPYMGPWPFDPYLRHPRPPYGGPAAPVHVAANGGKPPAQTRAAGAPPTGSRSMPSAAHHPKTHVAAPVAQPPATNTNNGAPTIANPALAKRKPEATVAVTATAKAAPGTQAASPPAKKPKVSTKPGTNPAAPPKQKESNRPLCEEDIIKTFPTDASSVMLIHGRKINLDSFSETAPLYPQLRAWVQDDPFRTVPRPESTIDYFRSIPKQIKPVVKRKAKCPPPDSVTDVAPTSSVEGDAGNGTEDAMEGDEPNPSMADLRKEMVQRAKKVRRVKSKGINEKMKLGLESLRQKGIHIS